MQPGLQTLKRIKFLFVQFQLLNLLPCPFTGTRLFLYRARSLSPCCQTDQHSHLRWPLPEPPQLREAAPRAPAPVPPHPAGSTDPALGQDRLLFPLLQTVHLCAKATCHHSARFVSLLLLFFQTETSSSE